MSNLAGKRIVLGVCGGIAAYKSAGLASKLVQAGATVDVILTESAGQFIGATTFEAITKRPVHARVFEHWTESSFGHVTLGLGADILVVAPATANTIARLAQGFADDMFCAVALSTTAPLLIAPAMEHAMYHHPATQDNLATLGSRGAMFVGPESGRLASGSIGDGRLAPVEAIVGAIRQILGRHGPLAGVRVAVSAGGTREPIDPVRFIGNRSSGLMGYQLAQAAIDLGADVTLVTTPTRYSPPFGSTSIEVSTAHEMLVAVESVLDEIDVLIMAAAVADFRPEVAANSKIKKQPGQERLTLELVRNPDIIATVSRPGLIKVGFAAETEDLVVHATKKLHEKGLAMIVANDAVSTIGHADIAATLIFPNGDNIQIPRGDKSEIATTIIEQVAGIFRRQCDG